MLRSTLAAPGLSRAEVPACLYYVWLPGVSQEHIEQPFCITATSEHDRVPRPEARSQLLRGYRVERCLPFSVKLAELYVWLPGVSQEHTANSTGRSAFLIPAPAARSGLTPPRLWVESRSKVGHVLVLSSVYNLMSWSSSHCFCTHALTRSVVETKEWCFYASVRCNCTLMCITSSCAAFVPVRVFYSHFCISNSHDLGTWFGPSAHVCPHTLPVNDRDPRR